MNALWLKYSDVFNGKAPRERIILAFSVLAALYCIFYFLFLDSMDKRKVQLQSRLTIANRDVTTLTVEEKVLAKAVLNDPNATKKQTVHLLQLQLNNLDENLEHISTGLIPSEKLPQALHDVLNSMGSLKLIGMTTKTPLKLQLIDQAASQEGGESAAELLGIYKHAVDVQLEGNYFAIASYLQALQKLPWKFYWESIDYRVEQYPKAQAVIEVYTLSTEKGLIGG
ncbi:MAG: MSHA biogenesis protein MshJ [Lentisphaeria bacterium]|jgi:MSHA biogenesis protein MshJ